MSSNEMNMPRLSSIKRANWNECFQMSTPATKIQVTEAIEQELMKNQDLEEKFQPKDNQIFSWQVSNVNNFFKIAIFTTISSRKWFLKTYQSFLHDFHPHCNRETHKWSFDFTNCPLKNFFILQSWYFGSGLWFALGYSRKTKHGVEDMEFPGVLKK